MAISTQYGCKATICLSDGAGWFVEWYWDDDDSSGYGACARVCRWWAGDGHHGDCIERVRFAPHDNAAPLGPATPWKIIGAE